MVVLARIWSMPFHEKRVDLKGVRIKWLVINKGTWLIVLGS